MKPTYRRRNTGKHGNTTHKLLTTATAVCLLLGATTSVFAQSEFVGSLNTVSISDAAGANNPPTASLTYTQDGDTFTFDASASSDRDGSIVEYKWNFGDGSTASDVSTEKQLQPGKYSITLTVVDNTGGVAITQSQLDYSTAQIFAINFQPASVPVPNGFQPDSGEPFQSSKGYGWATGPSSSGLRDRDSTASINQAFDTMVHVAPSSVWEIAVPNGNYTITVVNGDATFPQGTQNVQAEGVTVIDNKTLSNDTRWVEGTANVSVSDGKLSLTFAGSSNPAKLCWLSITSN